MSKVKMLTLGMALILTALATRSGSAATQCEIDCRIQYDQCKVFCSKNPCFVPCEYNYNTCLSNCGSAS
jgi:hypothetical protein